MEVVKADGQEQGGERSGASAAAVGCESLFSSTAKCSVKTNLRHRQKREIYPANQSLSLLSVAFFGVPFSGHRWELLPGAQFPAGKGGKGWMWSFTGKCCPPCVNIL